MSRLQWLFHFFLRYYRSLGLRVSLYAVLSLLAALISPAVQRLIGPNATELLDFGSVTPVLTILATSMLAVSTFSLNIMVSAYRAAAASTTPRAHRILLENTTTQSVLATFIGAFVYALVSIILYQVGFYPADAAVVVMAMTILVVALVVVALLRWIEHLSTLGSVDDSIDAVAKRAEDALSDLASAPTFGASPITAGTVIPTDCSPVTAPRSGYLQIVDVPGLHAALAQENVIYLRFRPGTHVLDGQVIAGVSGTAAISDQKTYSDFFTIGNERTFEQDANYGLCVLAEIASKALSPGINDPGTAIAVLHRTTALLWGYALSPIDVSAPQCPRVFVPHLAHVDMLNNAFAPIARDGAGVVEVATELRTCLAQLASSGHGEICDAARTMAANALELSKDNRLRQEDLEHLRKIEV